MSMLSSSYALGLFFLLLVGLIWAGASVLMQHIYADMDFHSPFFLTFLTNSLLMIYLPLWQLWLLLGAVTKRAADCAPSIELEMDSSRSVIIPTSELHDNEAFSEQACPKEQYNPLPSCAAGEIAPVIEHTGGTSSHEMGYTHMDVIRVAIVIAPLYVLSNGLYNYSLFITSVSSATIISNLSGTFTFAFSWYLGVDTFTYGKVFGILACFLGAVCVGLNDSKDSGGQESSSHGAEHSVGGDSVALLGAVFYGLYTTVIKYMIPDDDGISMQLLLGYVGLINVVFLAPVLVFLYLAGTEHFEHLTWTVFGYMCISGLFNNVISDYLWARSVVLTSSTVATVGLSITIPLAMVSDFIVQNRPPTALSGAGAALVIIGFSLVNITREAEIAAFMYCCGDVYMRFVQEGMLRGLGIEPIKRKNSELDVEELVL